jgi:hypothetical protein
LLSWLGTVCLIPTDSVSVWRDARSRWCVGSDSSLPGFLQEERGDSSSILRGNHAPERGPVGFIDVAETLLVNAGDVHLVRDNVAIQAERWLGSGVGQGTAGRRRLGENCNGVAESSRWAVRG